MGKGVGGKCNMDVFAGKGNAACKRFWSRCLLGVAGGKWVGERVGREELGGTLLLL